MLASIGIIPAYDLSSPHTVDTYTVYILIVVLYVHVQLYTSLSWHPDDDDSASWSSSDEEDDASPLRPSPHATLMAQWEWRSKQVEEEER